MRESRNSFGDKEKSGIRKAQRAQKTFGKRSSSQNAEGPAPDAALHEISFVALISKV